MIQRQHKKFILEMKDLIKSLMTFCKFKINILNDEISIFIQDKDILKTLMFFKDNPSFNMLTLIDFTVVDYPNEEKRFQLIYNLLSVSKNFSTAVLPCMAGAPLLVVPSGLSSKTNMPLGLSFTGTVGSDSLILEIGYAFEQCREQSLDIHPPQLFVENEETLVRKILVKGKL